LDLLKKQEEFTMVVSIGRRPKKGIRHKTIWSIAGDGRGNIEGTEVVFPI